MRIRLISKIIFSVILIIAFNSGIQAQVASQNCNSAPIVIIPIDGATIQVQAIYDNFTTASYQGLHPCVGTVDPPGIGPDVWFKFVATSSEVLMLDFSGLTGIILYRGSCGQLTVEDYISNGNYDADCSVNNSHPFNTIIGETYYVQISFYGGQTTYPIQLQSQDNAPNQDCGTAKNVLVSDNFDNAELVSSAQFEASNTPSSGCADGTNDAWYSFIAPPCGGVEYNSGGLGSIYGGTCASLQFLACFNGNGSLTGLTPGQTYFMQFKDIPSTTYSDFLFIQPFIGSTNTPTNISCNSSTTVDINQNYPNIELSNLSLLPTTNCNGSIVAKTLWYNFKAIGNVVNANVNGATSELYGGNCNSLVQEPCSSDGVYAGLTNSDTYYLKVMFDADYNANNFDLEITIPTNGQTCETPLNTTVNSGSC